MVEQEKVTQGEEEESPGENINNGNQQKTPTLVESAHQAAERLEKALDRLEAAEARRRLSGETHGAPQEEKPKEESAKEYADRVLKGNVEKN